MNHAIEAEAVETFELTLLVKLDEADEPGRGGGILAGRLIERLLLDGIDRQQNDGERVTLQQELRGHPVADLAELNPFTFRPEGPQRKPGGFGVVFQQEDRGVDGGRSALGLTREF